MGLEKDCVLHIRMKLWYLYDVLPTALLLFSLKERVMAKSSCL